MRSQLRQLALRRAAQATTAPTRSIAGQPAKWRAQINIGVKPEFLGLYNSEGAPSAMFTARRARAGARLLSMDASELNAKLGEFQDLFVEARELIADAEESIETTCVQLAEGAIFGAGAAPAADPCAAAQVHRGGPGGRAARGGRGSGRVQVRTLLQTPLAASLESCCRDDLMAVHPELILLIFLRVCSALLEGLEGAQRETVMQGNGLKIEQLKAEIQIIIDTVNDH